MHQKTKQVNHLGIEEVKHIQSEKQTKAKGITPRHIWPETNQVIPITSN
jgi:hypothetical protein